MDLRIIAVPYDTAIRDWRMGAGPDRLLECGLEDHLRAAGHRVAIERIELPPDEPTSEISTAFELAVRLRDRIHDARSAGELPIVLAGNCGTALGTLAALADAGPGVGLAGCARRSEHARDHGQRLPGRDGACNGDRPLLDTPRQHDPRLPPHPR